MVAGLLLLAPAIAMADDGSSPASGSQLEPSTEVQADDVVIQPDLGVDVAGVQVGMHCVNWGGTACLIADVAFDGDLRALGATSVGQALLTGASRAGVNLIALALPNTSSASTTAMGSFVPAQNSVRIAAAVQTYPQADRLAILTHELQHALDAANGMPITTPAGCYSTEENAVTSEVRLWRELFDGALPAPRTPYEAWLNTASRSSSLSDVIRNAYVAECGAALPAA